MKKQIATGLTCLMLMTMPAWAETTESQPVLGAQIGQDMEASVSYEGRWVTAQGLHGTAFDIFLPAAWEEADCSAAPETDAAVPGEAADAAPVEAADEQVQPFGYDENAFYAAVGGDGEWGIRLEWREGGIYADAAALQAEMALVHPDAEIVNYNGTDYVRYTDAEADVVQLLLPEAEGLYVIAIGPASDADFAAQRDEILTTVTAYTAEATEE